MSTAKWSVLAALWVLLGVGILVSAGIDAWNLARSEFAREIGIWLTILLFALFGFGAILFGWRSSAPVLWTRVLGSLLCVLSFLYTLFILAITPDRAIVRPLLALQIAVMVLAVWTMVDLWRKRASTATTPKQ